MGGADAQYVICGRPDRTDVAAEHGCFEQGVTNASCPQNRLAETGDEVLDQSANPMCLGPTVKPVCKRQQLTQRIENEQIDRQLRSDPH